MAKLPGNLGESPCRARYCFLLRYLAVNHFFGEQLEPMTNQVDQPKASSLPWGIRTFNYLGNGLRRLGIHKKLDADGLMAAARKSTGLQDFGEANFEEPFRLVTADLQATANPTPFGRNCLERILQQHLVNRLLLTAAWQRHPEALQLEIVKPLYVVGMPRTGTTLLYNLLCQDPQARPLMIWEAMYPALSAADEQPGRSDPRPQRIRNGLKLIQYLTPGLQKIHPMYPDGPEECGWLMSNDFISQMFFLNGPIPRYEAYFRNVGDARLEATYRYYRRQLQLLQFRDGVAATGGKPARHWVLKSPVHQTTLLPLMTVLDSANVVQTHRNPRDVVASCCSLFATLRQLVAGDFEPRRIGPEILERMEYSVQQAQRAEAAFPDRLTNVLYDQLVSDPIGTVRHIYERFGYDYTPALEDGMRRWLAANPRNKFGAHHYDLAQFGLSSVDVDARLGSYWARVSAGG